MEIKQLSFFFVAACFGGGGFEVSEKLRDEGKSTGKKSDKRQI
jgi:hypothetical protein